MPFGCWLKSSVWMAANFTLNSESCGGRVCVCLPTPVILFSCCMAYNPIPPPQHGASRLLPRQQGGRRRRRGGRLRQAGQR